MSQYTLAQVREAVDILNEYHDDLLACDGDARSGFPQPFDYLERIISALQSRSQSF